MLFLLSVCLLLRKSRPRQAVTYSKSQDDHQGGPSPAPNALVLPACCHPSHVARLLAAASHQGPRPLSLLSFFKIIKKHGYHEAASLAKLHSEFSELLPPEGFLSLQRPHPRVSRWVLTCLSQPTCLPASHTCSLLLVWASCWKLCSLERPLMVPSCAHHGNARVMPVSQGCGSGRCWSSRPGIRKVFCASGSPCSRPLMGAVGPRGLEPHQGRLVGRHISPPFCCPPFNPNVSGLRVLLFSREILWSSGKREARRNVQPTGSS